MSDNLRIQPSDEIYLLRARSKAASNKKQRESAKQKDRKKQFWSTSFLPTPENSSNLLVDRRQAPVVAFRATNMDQKFVISAEKKDIINTVASSKEINFPECELDRG